MPKRETEWPAPETSDMGKYCDTKHCYNRPFFGGGCYCEYCLDKYKEKERQETSDVEKEKSLGNTDINGAKKNVSDLVTFGDGDMFQLLCKASSKAEGWMKSTKAMEIEGWGCLVQVTTQQGDNVAEAVTWVPGVAIVSDVNGGRKLRKIF